jgi:tetratricopeptide (TPR) repeat protein
MQFPRLTAVARRPPIIIASLLVLAILGFWGVNHLVVRFREQEKALARRLFRLGQNQVASGRPEQAIDNFRAALAYDRSNFQYQLSLARALRDTGRVSEAHAYLLTLWERTPEDSTVNLALARLAVRENSVEDALRFYHNAIYGAWPADGDSRRRDAQFELVDFLLKSHALPQAQAELITLSPSSPNDAKFHLRLGQLFVRVQDDEHALAQFQQVLRLSRENVDALAGAGEAAYHLGRYRSAAGYLETSSRASADTRGAELLKNTEMILQNDPYARRISNAERLRRVRDAFQQAGTRIDSCGTSAGTGPTSPAQASDLVSLKSRWAEMKPKVARLRPTEMETYDAAMDVVFQIEQATATHCGAPNGLDQALLTLAQDRTGAER